MNSYLNSPRSCGIRIMIAFTLLLTISCTAKKDHALVQGVSKTTHTATLDIPLQHRLAIPDEHSFLPNKASEPLYSLRIKSMDITRALALFAKVYKLNIIPDGDIQGSVSVDFHDLSFAQAMNAMLGSLDYYWYREHNLIRVQRLQTRNFTVNYVRLVRSSSASSTAGSGSSSSGGDSSSSGGDSSSGGGSGESSSVQISQQDSVQFWGELEKQLALFISKQGTMVVNRMAGIIHLTDKPSRVKRMDQFIRQLNDSIHRQVQINVKIVEVTLSDDFRLGIDWSRIDVGSLATRISFSTHNAITTPAGGLVPLPKSFSLNIGHKSNRGKGDINSIIEALSEQGKVKVISQPKVRAMNNQPAMIKVGTDRTFFRKEQETTTGTATTTSSTDVPQVVTEGIVLAITPQISANGWVMLDISPVITRVSSTTETVDAKGVVQSSAPNLDIRQTSSLVRARDGSTVIIGGLIQETTSDTERKVPLLGDIPLLGYFFKGISKITKRKELVIFLTPEIIDVDERQYPAQG